VWLLLFQRNCQLGVHLPWRCRELWLLLLQLWLLRLLLLLSELVRPWQ
jgi:hypothetical protein